jgi:hypothetical protein
VSWSKLIASLVREECLMLGALFFPPGGWRDCRNAQGRRQNADEGAGSGDSGGIGDWIQAL